MSDGGDRRLPALVIAATVVLVLWQVAATAALREERRGGPEDAGTAALEAFEGEPLPPPARDTGTALSAPDSSRRLPPSGFRSP